MSYSEQNRLILDCVITLRTGQNSRHFANEHFQVHFREWKLWNFKWNFAEICSLESNWQYSSIGSDNGLSPVRRQVIAWTDVVRFTDTYMRHSAPMIYANSIAYRCVIMVIQRNISSCFEWRVYGHWTCYPDIAFQRPVRSCCGHLLIRQGGWGIWFNRYILYREWRFHHAKLNGQHRHRDWSHFQNVQTYSCLQYLTTRFIQRTRCATILSKWKIILITIFPL